MSEPSPPVTPEEMLTHAPWVRALAREMLRDESLVDDAVQHTLIAALRSPPRDRSKLRAWIRVVVRNFARDSHSAEQSRMQHERAAARSEIVSATDDLYERAFRHRQVVSAVLTLDDTSRTILLMRYFDDLPPREIAKRLRIPVETAETRLKRARQRLREALQRDAAEIGLDWTAIVIPLTGLPRAPAAPAAPVSRLRPSLRWALVASSALIVASFGAAALQDERPAPRDSNVAEAPAAFSPSQPTRRRPASRVSLDAPPASGDKSPEPTPVHAADVSASAGSTRLRGSVRADEGDAPATVVLRLTAVPADPSRTSFEPRTVGVPPGEFAIDVAAWSATRADVVAVDVTPDLPDFVPAPVRVPWPARAAGTVDLPPMNLRRAAIVTGRVEGGAPGVPVVVAAFAHTTRTSGLDQIDECRVGPDGAYRLRIEPNRDHAIVLLAPGRAPQSHWVRTGAAAAVGSCVLTSGATCEGLVTAGPGVSLQGAVVQISARASGETIRRSGDTLAFEGDCVMRCFTTLPLGADGRFKADGLAPGPYRVAVGGAGIAGDLQESLAQDVTLPHDALAITVAGQATDVEVAGPYGPVDRATILVRAATPGAASSSPVTGVLTDPAGHARLVGVPGHRYTISVDSPGFLRETLAVSMQDETSRRARDPVRVELRPAAADATWAVQVDTDDGTAPEQIGVAFFPPGQLDATSPLFVRDATRGDGVFRVGAIPPGRYRVVLRAATTWAASRSPRLDVVREMEFSPGVTAASQVTTTAGGRLRLTATDERGTVLRARVRIRDARGTVVPIGLVLRDGGVRTESTELLGEFGPTEVSAALPAGTYTVEFSLRGRSPVRREVRVEAGEVLDVTVTLPPG